jgi:hypothetical protein
MVRSPFCAFQGPFSSSALAWKRGRGETLSSLDIAVEDFTTRKEDREEEGERVVVVEGIDGAMVDSLLLFPFSSLLSLFLSLLNSRLPSHPPPPFHRTHSNSRSASTSRWVIEIGEEKRCFSFFRSFRFLSFFQCLNQIISFFLFSFQLHQQQQHQQQKRFSQRTDRVKGVDLHPTEPW